MDYFNLFVYLFFTLLRWTDAFVRTTLQSIYLIIVCFLDSNLQPLRSKQTDIFIQYKDHLENVINKMDGRCAIEVSTVMNEMGLNYGEVNFISTRENTNIGRQSRSRTKSGEHHNSTWRTQAGGRHSEADRQNHPMKSGECSTSSYIRSPKRAIPTNERKKTPHKNSHQMAANSLTKINELTLHTYVRH